jgi:multiple RNA-binding domain-containing protein 1
LVENKRKDANLEEFMEVMQPKSKKAASWVDQVDPLLPSPGKECTPVSQGVQKSTSEGAQEDLTDIEWMRQRMKEGVVDADGPGKVFEQSDSEEESQGVLEEKNPIEETILRTARLFVRNLTFTCTEEELRPLFQAFGAVSQVRGIYKLRWFMAPSEYRFH